MSVLVPSAQFSADDRSGRHFVITEVYYNASGDTVTVPAGVTVVTAMVTSGTAPTAAATAVSTGDTITLTGGSVARTVYIVSLHAGRSASGLGAA